jgi:hypothetical protein
MNVRDKVKQVYGLSGAEYDCLVRFGESPFYLRQSQYFDRYDLDMVSKLKKLIAKGFVTYNEETKEVLLTAKGEEVWNLED